MRIEEIFCNGVTKINRCKFRNSPVECSFNDDYYVIGYVYEKDGRYHKYFLMYQPDNIAKFICSSNKDKLLFIPISYQYLLCMISQQGG